MRAGRDGSSQGDAHRQRGQANHNQELLIVGEEHGRRPILHPGDSHAAPSACPGFASGQRTGRARQLRTFGADSPIFSSGAPSNSHPHHVQATGDLLRDAARCPACAGVEPCGADDQGDENQNGLTEPPSCHSTTLGKVDSRFFCPEMRIWCLRGYKSDHTRTVLDGVSHAGFGG